MKLSAQQKKIFLTLLFIGTFANMDKSMIGLTVLQIGNDFDLLPSQTSIILSVFYISFIAITLPGGWFVDRFGYKKFTVAALTVLTLFTFVFSLPSSLALLAFLRLMVGFGQAGYTTGSPKIISENFTKEQSGTVLSIVLATAGVGGVLAYSLGSALININWRMAYWVLTALFLVALLMMIFFVPEKKQEKSNAPKVSFVAGWKSRNTLVLALGMLFNNLVAVALLSWLPSVLTANFGMTTGQISLILIGNSVIMAISIAGAGILVNKYFAGKEKLFILTTSICTGVALIIFISSSNMTLTIILLYLITILSMAAFTGFLGLPYKVISMSIIGSSFAVINIGAFIGGIISPLIIGNLVTAAGGSFYTGYIAMAVAIVISGLSPLLLGKSEQTA